MRNIRISTTELPMNTPKLTTMVYKYKRYAPWMVAVYALATVLFFAFSPSLSPLVVLLAMIMFVAVAVYAGLRTTPLFSMRSVDERKLTLTPDELVWGNWLIPIGEVEDLEVYIHAFNSFRHREVSKRRGRRLTVEYGDRNKLNFSYRGAKYDLTFYLGTFEHYETLLQILQSWRESGILFSARSAFADSYIREHVNRYG